MQCIQVSLPYPDRNVTAVQAMGPDSYFPGSTTKTETNSIIRGEIFSQAEETVITVWTLGHLFLQETTQKLPSTE